MSDNFSPRRSSRRRKPSSKSVESVISPKKDRKSRFDDGESDSDFSEPENKERPQILHNSEQVSGDKLFTFNSRKKCEVVIQQNLTKTPHSVRRQFKKDLDATILEDSNEEDFSDSGSEYVASESDSGESESQSSDDSTENESVSKERPIIKQSTSVRKVNKKYTIKTDDYFSNHASKKIQTSNHTLDKLETPRLPQDHLQKLLSKLNLSSEHTSAKKKLINCNHSYFEKWMYLMHENINILLYGLGSKKSLLDSFQEQCVPDLPTLVINGFFPSLSIKDILDGIILNLLDLKENPANIFEACELIENEFSYIPDTHLYLIIHNIDMIRGGKAQSVFARLAAVKNIHLIASIDHINAPLIWDHSKLSKFNFTWWDVTTYESYFDETSFESSMMVQRTGTLALSSLRNVFLSLTSNSKGIYLVLVKYQIENGKKQYYQGLAFKDLYSLCREAFLVSSDLALRAQLTEFVDHKMVKFKRTADGAEYLIIPISNTVLQQFQAEQQNP